MTEPLTLAQRLDVLRIKAFKSNSADDTAIYYNQLSLAFQRGELVDASTIASLRDANKALTAEYHANIDKLVAESDELRHARNAETAREDSISAELAEARKREERLLAAISWIEPPFLVPETKDEEVRSRIALCLKDTALALSNSKEASQ